MSSAFASSSVAVAGGVPAAKKMPKKVGTDGDRDKAGTDGKQEKAGIDGKQKKPGTDGENEEAGTDDKLEEEPEEGPYVPRIKVCRLWDRDRAMRADRLIWACNAEKWACGEAELGVRH